MTARPLKGNADVGSNSAAAKSFVDVQVAIGERTGHVYMVSRVDDDVRHDWDYEVGELPDERVEIHLLRAVKVSPEPAFVIEFDAGTP